MMDMEVKQQHNTHTDTNFPMIVKWTKTTIGLRCGCVLFLRAQQQLHGDEEKCGVGVGSIAKPEFDNNKTELYGNIFLNIQIRKEREQHTIQLQCMILYRYYERVKLATVLRCCRRLPQGHTVVSLALPVVSSGAPNDVSQQIQRIRFTFFYFVRNFCWCRAKMVTNILPDPKNDSS